jgi:hypothetical protein
LKRIIESMTNDEVRAYIWGELALLEIFLDLRKILKASRGN